MKRRNDITRRDALLTALFGTGYVGLRALATGLPAALLLNPRRALAQTPPACFDMAKAQYVIFSDSDDGDPINANVPGTYADAGIAHPLDPMMAATNITLSGKQFQAAAPWATLPQTVLDRTCFFHHTTLTNSHSNHPKVMSLMGGIKRNEMLVSMLAAQLAPCLGTVQPEPISLGASGPGEALSAGGRTLPRLSAPALKSLLTSPAGVLTDLQKLRDQDLDKLNALFRREGTASQRDFLDRYARSQQQARSVGQSLLNNLTALTNNSPDSQVTAAVVLIQMNVAPVISIRIPFGGDNHTDANLANETRETVAGMATLNKLMQQLTAAGLQDRVTFANLNVFGRTLSLASNQRDGRDHLLEHHVTVMIGKGIKGSVIGGVAPKNGDYAALPINSQTGAGAPDGDIAFGETFGAMGKTLGAAVGVNPAVLEDQITLGKIVRPALV